MVLPSMQWPQSLLRLIPWMLSIEWPGWWHSGDKWFWRIILLTLGLHCHKGSGRKGKRLWQRSSDPGHTRFHQIWISSASYSGHTYHQLDHKHDQGEQNIGVVGFLELVEDIPFVGKLLNRTFHQKWNGYELIHGSDWTEGGCQDNKEGRNRSFFIQDHTHPDKDHNFG